MTNTCHSTERMAKLSPIDTTSVRSDRQRDYLQRAAVRGLRNRRGNRRGIVLIVVAVVTALVSLSALGFLVSMKAENRAAHLQADQQQVSHVADSANLYLQQLAALSADELESWGGLQDNAQLFQDVPVDLDPWGDRHGRFSILVPEYSEEASEAVYHFGVGVTSAKLNLGQLLIWDEEQPGSARLALMNLPGMSEPVADSILDWIDADDEVREFGAESEFYLGKDPPRQPPNQIPGRLSELLAVRGVHAWQLLGNPSGQQRVISGADAQRPQTEPGEAVGASNQLNSQTLRTTEPWQIPAPPWSAFLTVVSAERNETASGRPRINLNQANLSRLHRELARAFDASTANFIFAIRRFGPSDTSISSALSESVPAVTSTGGGVFEFESALDLVDMVALGDDSEDAKSYRSPFLSKDSASLARLARFLDQTTIDQQTTVPGRINIMLAPRPVLLGIPGVTAEFVDQLIAARDSRPPGTVGVETRQHAIWILLEGLVDVPTMKQILPYITVGGNVFEAQVVAYYDAKSPWARHEIIIDGSVPHRRTLYYSDLRRLGRGFRYQDLVIPTAGFSD